MKKISEYKNEEALDLLAEIIEPLSEIVADRDITSKLKNKGTLASAVSLAIKRHKNAVIALLAALDGVPVDEYECGVFTLPSKLIEVLNDKELMAFFGLPGVKKDGTSSGSATASTEE